jgi:hypothetical protein
MIDASMVTSSAPIVVLVSATHLYLLPSSAVTAGCPPPARALIATLRPPALAARP